MSPFWQAVLAELLVSVTGLAIAYVLSGRVKWRIPDLLVINCDVTLGIGRSGNNPSRVWSLGGTVLCTRNTKGGSGVQHTLGHYLCPACENERRKAMDREQLSLAPFRAAATDWLSGRRMFLSPRTMRDNAQYIKTLSAFLGDIVTKEIHIGNVRGYQEWRRDQGVGNLRINHEVTCLGQILKEAGTWHHVHPYYKSLPVSREGPGVALTEDQKRHLIKTAKKDTRWEVALHATILSVTTTAGPGEIRHLRLKDIDIPNATIHIVKGAKNRYRIRSLELNEAGVRSARYLLERAYEKGCAEPDHYLLPHRGSTEIKKYYDPTRPQGHWNKAWDRLRKAAGLPKLRQYDLRHTAITSLLESNVPERVVISIAGHVSNAMLERYSHQRKEARRAAVATLEIKDA